MKIKLEQKSHKNVAELPVYKNKTPKKQRAFWRFLMKTLSAKDLKDCRFTYELEGMEKLGKDEPCLFLMNHSSFTDLEIFSTLFSDRQYHIVMTLDGFVGKEWLMRSLGCIPARKFITDIKLLRAAAPNLCGCLSLAVYSDSYMANRGYFDKIAKSYSCKME